MGLGSFMDLNILLWNIILSNFFICSEENAEEKIKSLGTFWILETQSFDMQRDEEIMNLYKSN